MKAWRCLVVLSFLLLGGCLVTFKEPIPPREAAPSHLLGTWSRENEWKEEQFLEITRSGSNVYRALSYVDSKDNTESLEDYGFTVSHQGKRWYLSAGLPKSLGGNFIVAGFEITDGDELVIYNLDVERIVEGPWRRPARRRDRRQRSGQGRAGAQPVGEGLRLPERSRQFRRVRRGRPLPAGHPMRLPMSQRKAQNDYQKIIRSLSDRIVEAQTPIRVLDAIKWDDGIRQDFLKGRGKHAPKVDRGYYDSRPLAFDASAKKQEFQNIERDITRQLGQFNPVGQIMRRMCKEYRMVIRMLEARGTPDLGLISQELYGSASDAFHAGDPTLADLGLMLSDYLNNIADRGDLKDEPKTLTAKEVVPILQARLNTVFGEEEGTIRVFESDGIVADAAAGADYIKVRADALFNERDVRALEVHEGLVHVGTTLNGLSQPICTFLAKGPPSSTVTQEGLAILMEVIAFASYPTRLRKLTNRTRAIHMAEEGADFLDVFHFYREQGYSLEDSYQNASRVFRGSTPDGLPFTKDLSYLKGFILIYNYIQLAVRKGKLEQIPLLFCGKTTLEDMRTLRQLVDEGLVAPPKYLPPQFRDLNALSAWMCFSNFLNHLSLDRIEADYANIL